MNQLKYRPEIDGIRALAVVSVLLFHLEYKFIPGGFVGVDVFFVISGYLITQLIYKDAHANTFSFKRFYTRRIRRLAPALIAVLCATFVVSSVFLTPDHFQRFSGALLSSVFSVSNIFFWMESGYFDASADLKPLLHTWSLSVEEQFYLVWPALIFFCRRQSASVLLGVFVALGVVSLIAAKMLNAQQPDATFFLMPFRVYEFALGAGLAMLPLAGVIQNRWREPACLAGLLLVIYSVLVFDKTTPFPDVYALVPCIGAVLLLAGGGAPVSGWLLRNPLSIWLGKISYSLYLVHWPVVVLYKHITFEDVIVGKTRIALLLITVLAAAVLWLTVENRFRATSGAVQSIAAPRSGPWFAVPALLIVLAGHAYAFNGWSGRFDPAVIAAIGNIEEKQRIRRQFIENPDSLSNLPFDNDRKLNLLIMGDSHATDVFNALYFNLQNNNSISIRRLEIDDTCLHLFAAQAAPEQSSNAQIRCDTQFTAVQTSELLRAADHIVISTRWETSSLQYLDEFADFLRQDNRELVIMGRTAEFKNVPSLVLKHGLVDDIAQQLSQARFTNLDKLNLALQQQSAELGLPFIDKLPYLCDLANNTCDVIDNQGKVLYTDYGHWSIEGAKYFGQRMLKDSVLVDKVLQGMDF